MHDDSYRPPAARELPPERQDALSRFLGGSPLAVLFRLILLSLVVGVLLTVFGLDPSNIIASLRDLMEWVWDLGFDAVRGLWRYVLLGAAIVVPIWLVLRLINAPRGR